MDSTKFVMSSFQTKKTSLSLPKMGRMIPGPGKSFEKTLDSYEISFLRLIGTTTKILCYHLFTILIGLIRIDGYVRLSCTHYLRFIIFHNILIDFII